jgi:hypothetical protein
MVAQTMQQRWNDNLRYVQSRCGNRIIVANQTVLVVELSVKREPSARQSRECWTAGWEELRCTQFNVRQDSPCFQTDTLVQLSLRSIDADVSTTRSSSEVNGQKERKRGLRTESEDAIVGDRWDTLSEISPEATRQGLSACVTAKYVRLRQKMQE